MNSVESAVEVDDVFLAAALMQSINILSHEERAESEFLEMGQGMMTGIRLRVGDGRPTGQASSPIALSRGEYRDEVLVLYRCRSLPNTTTISIGRYSRGGATAGTRNYYQWLVRLNKLR